MSIKLELILHPSKSIFTIVDDKSIIELDKIKNWKSVSIISELYYIDFISQILKTKLKI